LKVKKNKNWRLKHVKTVKLMPGRVVSSKRVTRFLVGLVGSCSGYPIINRVVFGSGSGWHVYIIGSVGLTRTRPVNPNCQPYLRLVLVLHQMLHACLNFLSHYRSCTFKWWRELYVWSKIFGAAHIVSLPRSCLLDNLMERKDTLKI
jgi:hypothetical protein